MQDLQAGWCDEKEKENAGTPDEDMVEKAGGPNNKETASSLGADETKIKRGFKTLIKEGKKARLPDEKCWRF